jgi:hypothetical protein
MTVTQAVVAPQLHPIGTAPGAAGSGRAAGIAQIHALALWLAEHPEAPMPTYLTATYSVGPREEVDEQTRVAGIESAARAVGIELMEGEATVQGDLVLASTFDGNPLTMIYRVAAHKDHGSQARYV